jgi:hypothetical protein
MSDHRRLIDRALSVTHAQRLITQPAEPARTGTVGGHGGEQPARQPLERSNLISLEPAHQPLNGGLPPAQEAAPRPAARTLSGAAPASVPGPR